MPISISFHFRGCSGPGSICVYVHYLFTVGRVSAPQFCSLVLGFLYINVPVFPLSLHEHLLISTPCLVLVEELRQTIRRTAV